MALPVETRTESDAFGDIEVPNDRYWGAQTQRSLQNFRINQPIDRMPERIIRAHAMLKGAAAKVNAAQGILDPILGRAIEQAAADVYQGRLLDHFPLVIWQTGSGTQTNMNVNEVISNRANELLGSALGSKKPVHPNDHVNMSGSSNDGFATSMHISAVLALEEELLPEMYALARAFQLKEDQFNHIIKIGRTHLQDAVPLTLGQEFSGFTTQITYGIERVHAILPALRYLPMGGTAVGTGLNAHEGFSEAFCDAVSTIAATRFTMAPNKFEAISANDALVNASGVLNTIACSLFKIANDIRYEGAGPRCGLAELKLPENEPGSSYMPGKVNPTQCESMCMLCCKVMGNHTSITMGGMSGQFQLNAFKPLIISSFLHSVRLLGDGMRSFRENMLEGLQADEKRIAELLDKRYQFFADLLKHYALTTLQSYACDLPCA